MPRNDKKIVNVIEKLGRKPQNVSTILITHFHIDHVGSLAKMKELTGALVAVHQEDADIIAGKRAPPKLKSILAKFVNSIMKPIPVEPDFVLREGGKVAGLQVIHTPGHTEGSISLFDKQRKVMFVGDAIRFINGKLRGPPERFTLDMAKAKESIKNWRASTSRLCFSGMVNP